jgi:hypothetical protein
MNQTEYTRDWGNTNQEEALEDYISKRSLPKEATVVKPHDFWYLFITEMFIVLAIAGVVHQVYPI